MAQRNVLGGELESCGTDPLTGFYRDGSCSCGPEDIGSHTICAVVTREFLEHQRSIGNDLSTPRPEFGFPGLQPGDRWCLCVQRWREALLAHVAPPIFLRSTHHSALQVLALEDLLAHALDSETTP